MRTVLAYLLLIATLLPTFSQWGTIAYYHVNKDYIAKVLCENRAKPQLHCEGKCYLAKKLHAQQEQQDKATAERVQKTPDFQLFFQVTSLFSFGQISGELVTTLPVYRLKVYSFPQSNLFQPPQV